MTIYIAMIGLLISNITFASSSKDCLEIKSEQIRLALTGSNLSNANTTRTPKGGPYRPFQIKHCMNGSCEVKKVEAPLFRYLPGHPDANENGYVAFPHLDKDAEFATFNISAAKLILLAKNKSCDTVLIDHGSYAMIRYADNKTDAREDIFNFDKDHRVVSWGRTDSKGTLSTVNFQTHGDVVSRQ